MAKQRRITVLIDKNGKITADAEGFTGDACLQELEQLLAGLDPWLEVTRKPDSGGGGSDRHRIAITDTETTRRRLGGLR